MVLLVVSTVFWLVLMLVLLKCANTLIVHYLLGYIHCSVVLSLVLSVVLLVVFLNR